MKIDMHGKLLLSVSILTAARAVHPNVDPPFPVLA
jgi:hypothetical protein